MKGLQAPRRFIGLREASPVERIGDDRPMRIHWLGRATFDESGLPGFEAVLHYGLLAPAGTPKAIVDRLSVELRKLVDLPEVQKQIHNEGGDPLTSTPAEYAADIDQQERKWGGLVKKLGLKVE